MGRSIGPPETTASGRATHQASQSVLSAEYREGRMFHVLSERGLTAEYEVAYQIGSGTKGRTYAVQVGRYLSNRRSPGMQVLLGMSHRVSSLYRWKCCICEFGRLAE